MAVLLGNVIEALEARYDPALAEGWDAVGLVCGDRSEPVRRVLFAVDPTAAVVDEVVAGGHVRDAVRRRFHAVIDAAGLDEDRARDWVVVRMVLNAHWSVEDAQRADRALDAEERAWITRCISIAKAVQD